MKACDILYVIGDIDDDIIKDAKERQRQSNKPIWVTLGSIAACFMLMFLAAPLLLNFGGFSMEGGSSDGGGIPEASVGSISIYTADGGNTPIYISSEKSVEAISNAITEILENSVDAAPDAGRPGDENVGNNNNHTSKDENTLKEGEYLIFLPAEDGSSRGYLLRENELVDIISKEVYEVTLKQRDHLVDIILAGSKD